MKTTIGVIATAAGIALGLFAPAAASAGGAQAIIGRFASAWDGIKTYQCTINSHELLGRDVQDRVYHFYFSKPLNTRAEIVAGDGRGSVGIWRGGSSVRGHQGGWLRGIKLNVNLHSRLATTLRGTTFADANLGALLKHLQSLPTQMLQIAREGSDTVLVVRSGHPDPASGITQEKYFFDRGSLPIRYEQYQSDTLVKRVTYSDMKLNPNLPPSLFDL